MRRLLLFTAALVACGRPEDLLRLRGSVIGADAGHGADGVKLSLLRDNGAGQFGCGNFTEWRQLASVDGGIEVDYLRIETTGREGFNRCLRLEWQDGESSAALSWLARDRDTQLPPLPTWADDPLARPGMPAGVSVLPQVLSFDLSVDSGVAFRQAVTTRPDLQLLGPGFSPGRGVDLVLRNIQRGQQEQNDSISQQPILPFDYVQRAIAQHDFVGDQGKPELGHGAACNVAQSGSPACALTDGLYAIVDPPSDFEPTISFGSGITVTTVIPRGMWAKKPFSTIIVEGQLAPGSEWTDGGAQPLERDLEADLTTSLADERAMLFPVLHWQGPNRPLYGVRVRVEDQMAVPVHIDWLSELSIY